MKKAKLILAAMFLLMAVNGMAQNVTLNDVQKKAQRATFDYLRTKKYAPSIDTNDQSVCYKTGDVLYWITFEGNSAPLLYTIHRKPVKFAKDDSKLNQKLEIAGKAANMVCAESIGKAFVNGSKVEFCLPVYAATPEDFQKVFDRSMNALSNIKKLFDEKYKVGRHIADTIHRYWNSLDTTSIVVPQNNVPGTIPTKNMYIKGISVRVVDADGTVISDYDKGIRKSTCRFLQEKVTLSATKEGVYKLGVKLYTPDGKLLLPTKNSRFTTITTIDVQKSNKPAEYELLMFGSNNGKLWKAGEYKIEFYEDDMNIYSDAINIL